MSHLLLDAENSLSCETLRPPVGDSRIFDSKLDFAKFQNQKLYIIRITSSTANSPFSSDYWNS